MFVCRNGEVNCNGNVDCDGARGCIGDVGCGYRSYDNFGVSTKMALKSYAAGQKKKKRIKRIKTRDSRLSNGQFYFP